MGQYWPIFAEAGLIDGPYLISHWGKFKFVSLSNPDVWQRQHKCSYLHDLQRHLKIVEN